MIGKPNFILFTLAVLGFAACQSPVPEQSLDVSSPSGKLKVQSFLTTEGQPAYLITYDGKAVIDTSTLGFEFQDATPLAGGMELVEQATSSTNETWEMPW
ncbi:MAG: glycoside hydrolase family 97 N-terminal domain-containing protein, partial [Phaeodactylibacter sp.]|nr:glycoside hydrolase family 97 N-terminal domain-containing protein [Phaeodactylibacter sp.]